MTRIALLPVVLCGGRAWSSTSACASTSQGRASHMLHLHQQTLRLTGYLLRVSGTALLVSAPEMMTGRSCFQNSFRKSPISLMCTRVIGTSSQIAFISDTILEHAVACTSALGKSATQRLSSYTTSGREWQDAGEADQTWAVPAETSACMHMSALAQQADMGSQS